MGITYHYDCQVFYNDLLHTARQWCQRLQVGLEKFQMEHDLTENTRAVTAIARSVKTK